MSDRPVLVGHDEILHKAERLTQPFNRGGRVAVSEDGNDSCFGVLRKTGHGNLLSAKSRVGRFEASEPLFDARSEAQQAVGWSCSSAPDLVPPQLVSSGTVDTSEATVINGSHARAGTSRPPRRTWDPARRTRRCRPADRSC